MKEKIYSILTEIRPEFDFSDSENFVEDGFLDSFDIVTIIAELEKTFGIIIDGLELIPENFESVDAIRSFINPTGK